MKVTKKLVAVMLLLLTVIISVPAVALTATYADDSGRLGFCDITKKKGFDFGKSKRVFRIDSEWYEKKEDFLKAIKKFSFGPTIAVKGGKP